MICLNLPFLTLQSLQSLPPILRVVQANGRHTQTDKIHLGPLLLECSCFVFRKVAVLQLLLTCRVSSCRPVDVVACRNGRDGGQACCQESLVASFGPLTFSVGGDDGVRVAVAVVVLAVMVSARAA